MGENKSLSKEFCFKFKDEGGKSNKNSKFKDGRTKLERFSRLRLEKCLGLLILKCAVVNISANKM